MKRNRTMDELRRVLEERRVKPREPSTHVTKEVPNFPPGAYYIDKNNEELFMKAVCNGVRRNFILAIAEKPGEYAPLRADFDFYAPKEVGIKRQYTEEDLKLLVSFYQDEIRNIVPSNEFTEEMLICIILEKEAPRLEEKGKEIVSKDGFHLHFPNFVCDSKIADYYLKKVITQKMIESKIFSNSKIATKLESMIDSLEKKPWMMYGCMNYKNEGSTPYLYNRKQKNHPNDPWKNVTAEWGHVFNGNLEEIDITDVFDNEMQGRPCSIKYYLPEFLSIRDNHEATIIRPEIHLKAYSLGPKEPNTRSKVHRTVNKNRSDEDIYKDLKTISDGHIMDMLSADRAEGFESWMDVGWTLFNITCGKEEGLKLWIDFSQRAPNFDLSECEKRWDTMEMRNKTLGSLMRMARKDSPEDYKKYKKTNTTGLIYESVQPKKCNEFDIAMVTVAEVGDIFKCVDSKKDIWYHFRDHRWHKSTDAVALKCKIVDVILQLYYDFKSERALDAKNDTTPERRSQADRDEGRAIEIIDQLKRDAFHKKVVNMCKIRLTDEDFLKKADTNTMLICCENGVLDLETGLFRDGRPDDYCTMTTGKHYRECSQDEEEELDAYLEKVFPNENIRNYALDMYTSCLQGGNIYKRIFCCTGETNGGKSMTMKLVGKAFGEYLGKLPRAAFIKGRSMASNANRPELVRMIGKRIVSTQEITHEDNFDIGPLKEFSGNDTQSVRGNYKDGDDVEFQFSIILQFNKPPKIPGSDKAVWDRMRMVPFEGHFVIDSDLDKYPVPETYAKQLEMKRFHADPNLKGSLDYLAEVFLWKIFKRFPRFKKDGLKDPKEVLMATNEYQGDNDIYTQFIKDKLRKVETDKASTTFITYTELYTEFKAWYLETYPSYAKKGEIIGKTVMRAEIIKKLGSVTPDDDLLYGFGDKGKTKNRLWGYAMTHDELANKNE